MLGLRARADAAREPAEREMAERALIALADELEHARALRDVVIRLGQAAGGAVQRAAQPQELAPCARHGARVDAARRCCRAASRASVARPAASSASHAMRSAWIASAGGAFGGDFVREPQRLVRRAAPRGQLGFEHADRPLVPQARLRAVAAVRLAGLAQVVAGRLIAAAHQRDLRERVEDGAGDFVELSLGCATSSARCSTFSARSSLPSLHENLSERGERNREAAPGADLLLQRRALFGQRQRLLVAVLNQRDVRLVVADDAEHVLRLHRRGEALGLPQARRSLLRCARPGRARRRTANGAAQDSGDCLRRAAPGRLWRCARGRSPCRRPACSRGPARNGRGRSLRNRAPARHGAARGRAARSRATGRLWQTRCGREAATASRAEREEDRRAASRAAVPSVAAACATSSAISQASASVHRRPTSSSCLSPTTSAPA